MTRDSGEPAVDEEIGRISVVIPTLDEQRNLPSCLAAVRAQEGPHEVLVVDGGSSDETVEIARAGAVRVLTSPPGRALQMNAGAAQATGAILLFLHADTLLPPGAFASIRRALAASLDAGAFRMRFDRGGVYRLAAWISDQYCRRSGDLFGDRAIFCRRSCFERVGGFADVPLMEDVELTTRLRRHGLRIGLLDESVVTSSRRFAADGVLMGGLRAWRLLRAYHRGSALDPEAAEYYTVPRR